jgi:hypothetical protein
VLHLLEEGDLADGGGGDALVLLLEADLLERDRLVGVAVLALVHHPVRALPDLLHLLVLRPTTIPAARVTLPITYQYTIMHTYSHTGVARRRPPRATAAGRGGGEGKGSDRRWRARSPGPWRGDPAGSVGNGRRRGEEWWWWVGDWTERQGWCWGVWTRVEPGVGVAWAWNHLSNWVAVSARGCRRCQNK